MEDFCIWEIFDAMEGFFIGLGWAFLIIIFNCFWGWITYLIGKNKGINGFWIGFLLNLIGVIIVSCMSDKKDVCEKSIIVSNDYNISTVNNKFDVYLNNLALIEKLASLRKSGAITEEEFENEKRKILR